MQNASTKVCVHLILAAYITVYEQDVIYIFARHIFNF